MYPKDSSCHLEIILMNKDIFVSKIRLEDIFSNIVIIIEENLKYVKHNVILDDDLINR